MIPESTPLCQRLLMPVITQRPVPRQHEILDRSVAACQTSTQIQFQVCFAYVCGQVQPLDVALSNSV
jgi:hypothetical protein